MGHFGLSGLLFLHLMSLNEFKLKAQDGPSPRDGASRQSPNSAAAAAAAATAAAATVAANGAAAAAAANAAAANRQRGV